MIKCRVIKCSLVASNTNQFWLKSAKKKKKEFIGRLWRGFIYKLSYSTDYFASIYKHGTMQKKKQLRELE